MFPQINEIARPPEKVQKVSVRNLSFYYGNNLALKNVTLPVYTNTVTAWEEAGPGCRVRVHFVPDYPVTLSGQ